MAHLLSGYLKEKCSVLAGFSQGRTVIVSLQGQEGTSVWSSLTSLLSETRGTLAVSCGRRRASLRDELTRR